MCEYDDGVCEHSGNQENIGGFLQDNMGEELLQQNVGGASLL